MKIKKTITITATEKEIQIIGDFIALFDEMHEDVWDEVNESTDYSLEDALTTIREFYNKIKEEYD